MLGGRRLIAGEAVERRAPRFVERAVERRDGLALRPDGRDFVEDRVERLGDGRALLDRDRLGRDDRDALGLDRRGDDLRTDRDDLLRLLLETDRDEPLLRGGPASTSTTATTAKSAATTRVRERPNARVVTMSSPFTYCSNS